MNRNTHTVPSPAVSEMDYIFLLYLLCTNVVRATFEDNGMYKKEQNTKVGAEDIQELLPEFFCTHIIHERIGINNNEGFVSNLVGGC